MDTKRLAVDYEAVARRIHDGESLLDLAIPGSDGRDLILRTTLADRVEVVSDMTEKALQAFPEFSFDVISCFAGYDRQADELAWVGPAVARLLKPAGRLLLLVPSDQAEAVAAGISKFLIRETITDGKCFPRTKMLMFMRNPLVGRGVRLQETCWKIPDDPAYNMNAFDRDYLNPWLIRGIVSGAGRGRMENLEAMAKIREVILADYPSDSVDYGAALCGKIYAANPGELDRLRVKVEDYCAIQNPIPHQLRWQISCGFALAALAERANAPELAKKWYAYASDGDVCRFSPTLGTKVMDACWRLANMALDAGEVEEAKSWLKKSFIRADEIVHGSWLNVAGDVSRPVPIAYEEMGLVCQKAARAAGMMNVLDRYPDRTELARTRAVSNAERFANVQDKLKHAQEEIRKLRK